MWAVTARWNQWCYINLCHLGTQLAFSQDTKSKRDGNQAKDGLQVSIFRFVSKSSSFFLLRIHSRDAIENGGSDSQRFMLPYTLLAAGGAPPCEQLCLADTSTNKILVIKPAEKKLEVSTDALILRLRVCSLTDSYVSSDVWQSGKNNNEMCR